MLGFSITSFTIFLAIGNDRFRNTISAKNKETGKSPLVGISSGFFHFIFLQILALTLAVVGKSHCATLLVHLFGTEFDKLPSVIAWVLTSASFVLRFVAFTVFWYALLSAFPTALSVFRLVGLFADYAPRERQANPHWVKNAKEDV
jgi:hypothetical protein